MRNLNGDNYWNFYEADVAVLTRAVLRTQSASAIFLLEVSFKTRLLKLKVMRKMSKCNTQMLHIQMSKLVFHLSTYNPHSFKHLSHQSTSFWMPDAKICWLLFKPMTNNWLHLSIWCAFLPMKYSLLVQKDYSGMSSYTAHISRWTSFAQRKMNNVLFITRHFHQQSCRI